MSFGPDTVVGPDSLANTMTKLRKVLQDDPKAPEYIKTVQRKGYIWLPQVTYQQPKMRSYSMKNNVIEHFRCFNHYSTRLSISA